METPASTTKSAEGRIKSQPRRSYPYYLTHFNTAVLLIGIQGIVFKRRAVYMKLLIFRWVIVVVLVVGAFLLGIEYQKFTNQDACLDIGQETPAGEYRICVPKDQRP